MNETPHRILVVDDEPSINEFVSYALTKEGFFTDVVDNGEDCAGGGDGGASDGDSDASDASEGDPGDAVSDMSD